MRARPGRFCFARRVVHLIGDWTGRVTMDDGPRTVAGTTERGLGAMRTEPPSPDPEVLPA
jgi:hypothetical protein